MEDNKNELENVNSEIENIEESTKEVEEKTLDYAQAELKAESQAETFKQMGPLRMILRRFFRSRLSVVGLVMVIFLFAFSFLGPVIYPVWGETGYDNTPNTEWITETIVKEDGIEITQVVEITYTLNKYANPSINHLLGTDDQAYDVFTRLMYGGRISLTIGFIVVILETIIGIIMSYVKSGICENIDFQKRQIEFINDFGKKCGLEISSITTTTGNKYK